MSNTLTKENLIRLVLDGIDGSSWRSYAEMTLSLGVPHEEVTRALRHILSTGRRTHDQIEQSFFAAQKTHHLNART